MQKQNYANHRKYYPPHHFVLLPSLIFFLAYGIRNTIVKTDQQLIWLLFSICIFFITYLSILLRQHYALGNQDRIVRLEFRLRYFELLGKSSNAVEKQLSFSQLAALRFAGDEEFKPLLEIAIQEKLSGNDIKKRIQNWQADDMRV